MMILNSWFKSGIYDTKEWFVSDIYGLLIILRTQFEFGIYGIKGFRDTGLVVGNLY